MIPWQAYERGAEAGDEFFHVVSELKADSVRRQTQMLVTADRVAQKQYLQQGLHLRLHFEVIFYIQKTVSEALRMFTLLARRVFSRPYPAPSTVPALFRALLAGEITGKALKGGCRKVCTA